MRLTTAILCLLTAACGAPVDPSPTGDAGSDARPIGAHGCRIGEVRLSGVCIPADDDNCGAIGRACAPDEECAVAGYNDVIAVQCVAMQ